MYSIDSALNTIWRSTRTRPKTYSFAVYWMILTLGPLLAGASLAISSLSSVVTLGQRPE
jgi:membrane protein